MTTALQDIVVIGGGINGAGIARDAARRGLKVTLFERSDLASGTSWASTKLIHGGLRYLECADFKLVREALREREILLRNAPHIVWPRRFVLPHVAGMRPAWMLRVGLFLYDHLSGRELLEGSSKLDLREHPAGAPLSSELRTAFEYSDCCVDDSRLVVLNAVDAAEHGAAIMTRSTVIAAEPEGGSWIVRVRDASGNLREVRSRSLVNAAGPWVASVGGSISGTETRPVRLVKGSHIVTRRLFGLDKSYLFQADDSRVAFVIPYERDFTLIGTTDIDHGSPDDETVVSSRETDYLLSLVNRYLKTAVKKEDIVWSFSGLRPLLHEPGKSASAVSREYVLDLDTARAPVLKVYGGKLTTYRNLAERAVTRLQGVLGTGKAASTATAPLPGGDVSGGDFDRFATEMRSRYRWMPEGSLQRMLRAYGTRVEKVLGSSRSTDELGQNFGCGLTESELDYLRQEEFAASADDVLWRRSKLGLYLSPTQADTVARYLGTRLSGPDAGYAHVL